MAAIEESIQKREKSVLPQKLAAGPHGLGDPDDRSLRKVEYYTYIKQMIEKKAKEEKCAEEAKGFFNCVSDAGGFSMLFSCRSEKDLMNNCLAKWYQDEELKKECTEEYLNARSEYRRTGHSEKYRKWKESLS